MKKMIRCVSLLAVVAGVAPAAVAQELPEWVRKLNLSGDVGVRTEFVRDEKAANPYDRVRERGRFRLGMETAPVDKVKVAFGVETTGVNPTSAWVDFSEFQNQQLFLSHASLQYAPTGYLTVSGGKLKSNIPYWRPTQLIWKNDVNPYGVAANFKAKLPGDAAFFANAGLFALNEYRDYDDNGTQADLPMNAIFIVQPGVEVKRGRFSLKGAFAVQQFSLVNHDASGWIKADRSYTLLNPDWDVSILNVAGPYRVNFSGEFSHNVNGSADGDAGAYLLSMGFGDEKIDKFKAWQVAAAYRRVEEDAIPVGMGQTSAYNAEPGKGWEYSFGLGLLKALSFNATVYHMTNLDGERPQLIGQFDLVYKF
ncbi:MAG: putative porin [Acidobacteriota bacterium]|nr:putative porin [Acidobacteriota bacterium]